MPSWLKKLPFWVLGISSNYRSDWQYLIAASRMNSALSLATLFSVIAIVTKITDLVNLGRSALYCFILAVIAYSVAILVIRFRAPAFLQEYPDYKTFEDKKHSHRWVLWEFHANLVALKNGFGLLPETVEKKLSLDVTTLPPRSRLPVSASFVRTCIQKSLRPKPRGTPAFVDELRVYEPLNFDRDLIMGFTIKSSSDNIEKKYVLPIRESDPKCDLKCKELFWIIFTAAAKENAVARWSAWALVRVSVLLLIAAGVLAVGHSLRAPTSSLRNASDYFHLA